MQLTDLNYQKKELPENLKKIGLVLLVTGVVLGIVAFFVDNTRASFNYLLSYTFLISIAVGALFLVALEYVTNADWSVPFRRIVEIFAANKAVPISGHFNERPARKNPSLDFDFLVNPEKTPIPTISNM